MREISRFMVDDQVYDAIEQARRKVKVGTAEITLSRNEWLRAAVLTALQAQGIKIKST